LTVPSWVTCNLRLPLNGKRILIKVAVCISIICDPSAFPWWYLYSRAIDWAPRSWSPKYPAIEQMLPIGRNLVPSRYFAQLEIMREKGSYAMFGVLETSRMRRSEHDLQDFIIFMQDRSHQLKMKTLKVHVRAPNLH